MNISSFFSHIRMHRLLLLLGSGISTIVCIVLQNSAVFPLYLGTFLFFSFVLFLLALYRLGWVFLLFVGSLPLEVVNLGPGLLGDMTVRPYQWTALILFLAVGARFLSGRLPFELFRPRFFDIFPLVIVAGSFLALFGAPDPALSLKQAIVVTSFVSLYFLVRVFVRTLYDVRQLTPFFLVSSTIVCTYALWQNVASLYGRASFQAMIGRPNATFSEADWLGLFVVLALGVGYGLLSIGIFHLHKKNELTRAVSFIGAFVYTTLLYTVLIITVARSAWLGALTLTLLFITGIFFFGTVPLRLMVRRAALFTVTLAVSFVVAIELVSVFDLSPFQFLNRIQSTGNGLQKITVSCQNAIKLPETIETVEMLGSFGCRHIPLEVIEEELKAGRVIAEVSRPDPNVAIRREIYGKVWEVLKQQPVFGIGFGSIASVLGTDERGSGLNASNIFLEVWLGSGLVGLIAFLAWLGLIGYASIVWYRKTEHEEEKLLALFLGATLMGLIVCNLFNSGLLLGFFFLFLALGAFVLEHTFTSSDED